MIAVVCKCGAQWHGRYVVTGQHADCRARRHPRCKVSIVACGCKECAAYEKRLRAKPQVALKRWATPDQE